MSTPFRPTYPNDFIKGYIFSRDEIGYSYTASSTGADVSLTEGRDLVVTCDAETIYELVYGPFIYWGSAPGQVLGIYLKIDFDGGLIQHFEAFGTPGVDGYATASLSHYFAVSQSTTVTATATFNWQDGPDYPTGTCYVEYGITDFTPTFWGIRAVADMSTGDIQLVSS